MELSIDEQKELLNALKKIQNICNLYRQHCSSCPLNKHSESIRKDIEYYNADITSIEKYNPCLNHAVTYNEKRKDFC